MNHRLKPSLAALAALVSFTLAPLNLTAQIAPDAEAAAHHAAIEAFYPVMLDALQNQRYDDARELCIKAIAWESSNPSHYYNLSCIEAQSGNRIMALTALGQAAALGFNKADVIANDPDLESIRSEPLYAEAYRKIYASYEIALAAGPAMKTNPAPIAEVAAAPVASVALASEVEPAPHRITGNSITGVFFMTKFWTTTNSLDTAVWYFSPEGVAYENPTGFSPAELAATNSQWRINVAGDSISYAGAAGKVYESSFSISSNTSFNWDGGIYTAAKPFPRGTNLVGTYGGGTSVTGASSSSTLILNADESYQLTGSTSAVTKTRESIASLGAYGGGETGTWHHGTYSLTLNPAGGQMKRSIAFIYEEGRGGAPAKFYYDGFMWSRK
jgi:hypothetical protein